MRIGLLTHYLVNNQGAQLQMLSMYRYLEESGHQVYILTYEKNFDFDENEKKKNSASILHFPYYIKEYLFKKGLGLTAFNVRKAMKHKKALRGFKFLPYDTDDVDAVIIGSDEVFSIDVGCNTMMYGHGINAPAIAYAPSFGRSTKELLEEFGVYDVIRDGLRKMYRLSARDTHTQVMIREMTGRDVPIVCDPVLLYDGDYSHVPVKEIRKKYLLVYSYDRHMVEPDEIDAIMTYARRQGLITVSCGTYHSWCDRNIACNAEEWYSYFRKSSCVLTDTFHGAVVAMRNHCNLAVFIRESINMYKLQSLLNETGLEERILPQITAKNLRKVFSVGIDYNKVDEKIRKMRKYSEEYLLAALDGARK